MTVLVRIVSICMICATLRGAPVAQCLRVEKSAPCWGHSTIKTCLTSLVTTCKANHLLVHVMQLFLKGKYKSPSVVQATYIARKVIDFMQKTYSVWSTAPAVWF